MSVEVQALLWLLLIELGLSSAWGEITLPQSDHLLLIEP